MHKSQSRQDEAVEVSLGVLDTKATQLRTRLSMGLTLHDLSAKVFVNEGDQHPFVS